MAGSHFSPWAAHGYPYLIEDNAREESPVQLILGCSATSRRHKHSTTLTPIISASLEYFSPAATSWSRKGEKTPNFAVPTRDMPTLERGVAGGIWRLHDALYPRHL